MFFKFRRMRSMDPLQVAMTGVRMGERYLQIFCSDLTLTSGLATKAGLSGVAALAAFDEQQAGRARKAGEKAGALIDVQVTSPHALPWSEDAFDMVVVDNTGALFSGLDHAAGATLLASALRVLRRGGRVEFIERDRGSSSASQQALQAAGFRPVRVLAEKDGFRFIEALKA